jgi:hypothetical protein
MRAISGLIDLGTELHVAEVGDNLAAQHDKLAAQIDAAPRPEAHPPPERRQSETRRAS